MWENNSYCRVVVCKNHFYHISATFIYRHKIPLAKTDGVTSSPPVKVPFKARCDSCGKEYVDKPSEVFRLERELPEGFMPHPLFREENA